MKFIRLKIIRSVYAIIALLSKSAPELKFSRRQIRSSFLISPTGGAVQQNGQTTAEIQEDVPLSTMSSTGNNKRHSTHDKLQFPRASLHAITTLGIT